MMQRTTDIRPSSSHTLQSLLIPHPTLVSKAAWSWESHYLTQENEVQRAKQPKQGPPAGVTWEAPGPFSSAVTLHSFDLHSYNLR